MRPLVFARIMRGLAFCRFASFLLVGASLLHADSAYFQRLLFDNSITADSYYHSGGKASAPSTLRLIGDRLPVETNIFYTGPNALRLDWTSKAQGGWEAEIRVDEWRNREIYFPGDTLYFWCYAPAPIRATDLPRIVLKDEDKNFTRPLDLGPITKISPPANGYRSKYRSIDSPRHRFTSSSRIAPVACFSFRAQPTTSSTR